MDNPHCDLPYWYWHDMNTWERRRTGHSYEWLLCYNLWLHDGFVYQLPGKILFQYPHLLDTRY